MYYGGEWGVEGMRTKDSDAALRPRLAPEDKDRFHSSLTDIIAALGHVHANHPEFWGGRYQELLLTNRQYAFARHTQGSVVITAANNDDQESTIFVPVPISASQAENLMDGTILSITDGTLKLTLSGNSGVVLKIREV